MPTERAHGVQIAKMCEAFSELGYRVVLMRPKRRNPITEDVAGYYNLRVTLEEMVLWVPDWKWLGPLYFPILSVYFSLSASVRARFVRTEVFVVTRDPAVAILTPSAVLEVHALPGRFRLLYALAYRRARAIISTNSWKAEKLALMFGVRRERICTLANGIDLEQFSQSITALDAREKLALPMDKKIVLFVGSLLSWKGADTLSQAAAHVPHDVNIVIVGGSPEQVGLYRARYPLSNLFFVSHQTHLHVPLYMKAADILVLPTSPRSEEAIYETSPLKLLEYMASERPIIASELPAIRELVDGTQVRFFEADNSRALAEAICAVLCEPEAQRAVRVKNAYHKVRGYTWRRRAQSILSNCNNGVYENPFNLPV